MKLSLVDLVWRMNLQKLKKLGWTSPTWKLKASGNMIVTKLKLTKKTNQQQQINISCLILSNPKIYTTNIHALKP